MEFVAFNFLNNHAGRHMLIFQDGIARMFFCRPYRVLASYIVNTRS